MTNQEFEAIKESARLMRARLESGQGGLHSAMCRLSLPMAEQLIAEVERLREENEELLEKVASACDCEWCEF